MDFQQNTQPIFMQIIDLLCDKVLRGELHTDDQIPSVREMAVQYAVNPNTVMRAIERLLASNIIYNRRGKGNYLCEGARTQIQAMRCKRLYEESLPLLASELELLNITPDEVARHLDKLIQKQS